MPPKVLLVQAKKPKRKRAKKMVQVNVLPQGGYMRPKKKKKRRNKRKGNLTSINSTRLTETEILPMMTDNVPEKERMGNKFLRSYQRNNMPDCWDDYNSDEDLESHFDGLRIKPDPLKGGYSLHVFLPGRTGLQNLDKLAPSYESFILHRIRYSLMATSEGPGTTTAGRIVAAINVDPSAKPDHEDAFLAIKPQKVLKPWQDGSLSISAKRVMRAKTHFIHSDEGPHATHVFGVWSKQLLHAPKIMVSYDITLLNPTLPDVKTNFYSLLPDTEAGKFAWRGPDGEKISIIPERSVEGIPISYNGPTAVWDKLKNQFEEVQPVTREDFKAGNPAVDYMYLQGTAFMNQAINLAVTALTKQALLTLRARFS